MLSNEDILIIHRYLSGQMTALEAAQFEQRIGEDPEFRSTFLEEKSLWKAADTFSPGITDKQKSIAKDALLTAIQDKSRKELPTRSFGRRWFAAAAAVALLILAGSAAYLFFQDPVSYMRVTATESREQVTLPDGSVVTLDLGATLQYPESFSGNKRELLLVGGKAAFDVVKNPAKPFVVVSRYAEVTVLGTYFSLHLDTLERLAEVFVKEGLVRFSPVRSEAFLEVAAGEAASYEAKGSVLQRRKSYNINAIAWLEDALQFYQTPMRDVFADLETYFGVEIDTGEANILNCRLNSTFTLSDMDCNQILNTLKLSFHFDLVSKGAGKWKVTGGTCK